MIKGRKILWVDREIQLKFVLFIIISLSFACVLVSVATFYNVWTNVVEKILRSNQINQIYVFSLKRFVILNFGLIILLALLATLGMLLVSHRVAGPAYRIKNILRELQEGKNPNFKLRKGDALKPIVEELEKFASQYRELSEAAIRAVESWKNTEVKDLSLNLALKELENKIIHLTLTRKEEEKNEERIQSY